MRSLETLLLLADLLTGWVLSIPRLRATPWMRLSASVALLIAGTQALVEGPRWQLLPAYALTALFFMASTPMRVAPAGGPAGRNRLTWVAIALGTLWLAGSAALPMIVPVFRFPTPTGPHAIGTLTYHWVDAARPVVFAADPQKRRELMVQVWYPASAQPSAPRAAYLPDAATVGPSYLPGEPDPTHQGAQLPNGRALKDNSIVPYLAKDVVFTLDQLALLNRFDPNGILTGKLDLQRVDAFGVSLGGIVVGEACRLDPRLRAGLVMDAPMSTDLEPIRK